MLSHALGEATIDSTPGSLVLSNLEGGDDGLEVSFDEVDAARLEWAPLRTTGDEPAFLEIETLGMRADGTSASLGSVAFVEDPAGGFVMEENLGGFTNRSLEILSDGASIARLDVTPNSEVRASSLPTALTAFALPGWPQGIAGNWPPGTVFEVDGAEFEGDELRLELPDTTGDDVTINECVVTAGGLEDITFTDISFGGDDACIEDAERVCLQQDRFQVEVSWTDFSGNSGTGRAVPLTSDTGAFWFFGPENIEVVVKVLDGRDLNDHFWVFYGALSNVEYQLRVTDTTTGAARSYFNSAGDFASFGDTAAFTADGRVGAGVSSSRGVELGKLSWQQDLAAFDGAEGVPLAKMACVAGQSNLCLNQNRFRVEVEWENFAGRTGSGAAVPLTSDTGYFWFFGPDNVEVVIKVLDGRTINGNFWVFYGALSNVGYRLTLTDTVTGTVKTYDNPLGSFGSQGDVGAFGS